MKFIPAWRAQAFLDGARTVRWNGGAPIHLAAEGTVLAPGVTLRIVAGIWLASWRGFLMATSADPQAALDTLRERVVMFKNSAEESL